VPCKEATEVNKKKSVLLRVLCTIRKPCQLREFHQEFCLNKKETIGIMQEEHGTRCRSAYGDVPLYLPATAKELKICRTV
jgi:hypothetical protein